MKHRVIRSCTPFLAVFITAAGVGRAATREIKTIEPKPTLAVPAVPATPVPTVKRTTVPKTVVPRTPTPAKSPAGPVLRNPTLKRGPPAMPAVPKTIPPPADTRTHGVPGKGRPALRGAVKNAFGHPLDLFGDMGNDPSEHKYRGAFFDNSYLKWDPTDTVPLGGALMPKLESDGVAGRVGKVHTKIEVGLKGEVMPKLEMDGMDAEGLPTYEYWGWLLDDSDLKWDPTDTAPPGGALMPKLESDGVAGRVGKVYPKIEVGLKGEVMPKVEMDGKGGNVMMTPEMPKHGAVIPTESLGSPNTAMPPDPLGSGANARGDLIKTLEALESPVTP